MKTSRFILAGAVAAALTACEGGGVNLNVSTVDNSVDNSVVTQPPSDPGAGSNPCASYTVPGGTTVRRGTFDGRNCTYNAQFVGVNNPLTVDVTIPFISGVHIFQDSLFVGTNVTSGAAPASGTGPKLTIEAGNKLAFLDAADYVLINRGSQIIANGSPTAPIVFTGFTDAVTGTAGAFDVQLWGGIVINGNGITNNCTDAERTANACHVVSEGQPSNYGGSNNDDNSGVLRYVIVKHAGFEVATDDELNGITFNAVGRGTTVENLQVYSAYDDGIEMFGGAVNVRNFIAMYVRDDSLDFSDGWVGTVENALIIHSQNDSNNCIELDNIGALRSGQGQAFDTPPVTVATVRNMTCITSNNTAGGTHGNSLGVIVRQGGRLLLEDSIVWGGYGETVLGRPSTSAQCYRLQSTTGQRDAQDGLSQVDNTFFACQSPIVGSFANGDTIRSWVEGVNPSANGRNYSFNTGNVLITDPANANVRLLNGYFTLPNAQFRDAANQPITTTPANRRIGAVYANDDWTAPWAFGLRAGNRAAPLWFQP